MQVEPDFCRLGTATVPALSEVESTIVQAQDRSIAKARQLYPAGHLQRCRRVDCSFGRISSDKGLDRE